MAKGGLTKTWVVRSGANARPTHKAMDGETVPAFQEFSNGMQFPGDSGDAAEVANCTCDIVVGGKVMPRWRNPAFENRLQTGNLEIGDQIGQGINNAHWGKIDGTNVVVKPGLLGDETVSELGVQYLNDNYAFNVLMPRVAENGLGIEGADEIVFVSAVAPGETLTSYAQGFRTYSDMVDVFRVDTLAADRINIGFMDVVTGQLDRNTGNILIQHEVDGIRRVVAIDHGMALRTEAEQLLEGTSCVEGTLTPFQMQLNPAQREVLEAMLKDEDLIRANLVDLNSVGLDEMYERINLIMESGTWDEGAWGGIPQFTESGALEFGDVVVPPPTVGDVVVAELVGEDTVPIVWPLEELKVGAERLATKLEELFGRDTVWNGEIRVGAESSVADAKGVAAAKDWDCGISLGDVMFGEEWTEEEQIKVMIHELMHAMSADLKRPDSALAQKVYTAFQPWEEGVAEGAARAFFADQGFIVGSASKVESYGQWVDGLDKAYELLHGFDATAWPSKLKFYQKLLDTPLEKRVTFINKGLETLGNGVQSFEGHWAFLLTKTGYTLLRTLLY